MFMGYIQNYSNINLNFQNFFIYFFILFYKNTTINIFNNNKTFWRPKLGWASERIKEFAVTVLKERLLDRWIGK